MLTILYFASLRETIGCSKETLSLSDAKTVCALIEYLKKRHQQAELALSDTSLRVAINQQLADMNAPLHEGDEVALFPPVTGG
jgi:molybdopterin synthase sulfur carrier subunit